MGYDENDYLQLSGLQHFSFCRRRETVLFGEELRDKVRSCLAEMHQY